MTRYLMRRDNLNIWDILFVALICLKLTKSTDLSWILIICICFITPIFVAMFNEIFGLFLLWIFKDKLK